MRVFVGFLGALAMGIFTASGAHAMDYSTQQRIYANEPTASLGGSNYRGGTISGNYYSGGSNNYYRGSRNTAQAPKSEWEKPKFIAPTYKKKAVNFNKSASAALMERQREGAERRKAATKSNSNYSKTALDVRLVNMGNAPRPTPRPNPNQVVLPQVALTPAAPVITAATPPRVTSTPAGTAQPSTANNAQHYATFSSGGAS